MARELVPCLAMILVQFGFAVLYLISKLALDAGMNPFVLVAYRQVFAALTISPLAYFWERKSRPRVTIRILCQIFVSSFFGVTMNQCLFALGLRYTTPTVASALGNLMPAITFIMAVPLGLESLGIKKRSGQAKVLGTILCVGGAMLMSFYKGRSINIMESKIHWRYIERLQHKGSGRETNLFFGPLLIIGSSIACSLWLIIQAKLNKTFAAPYSSTALLCLMATLQCGVVGICVEHNISGWSLKSPIRLTTALYSGIAGSLIICIMSWCIEKGGPLYVSMFNPLVLVVVAVIGWAILNEKLHIGSALGSALIVLGLYIVLWGKEKEIDETRKDNALRSGEEHEELGGMELSVHSNGNLPNDGDMVDISDGTLR